MYHSGYFAERLFAASFPSNRRWYLLFGADRWHLQISFALFLYYLHFPGRWKATLQVDDRRKILTSSILLKAIFCRIVPIPSVMLLTGIQTFLCLYPATGLVQIFLLRSTFSHKQQSLRFCSNTFHGRHILPLLRHSV